MTTTTTATTTTTTPTPATSTTSSNTTTTTTTVPMTNPINEDSNSDTQKGLDVGTIQLLVQ